MTKTVIVTGKAQRAGAGGNRYEYGCDENHFRVAVRKHEVPVETDVFPTLQGTKYASKAQVHGNQVV